MNITKLKSCVEFGALWLDENHPDWQSRINLNTLNIRSCRNCILGQLFGGFICALTQHNIRNSHRFGFTYQPPFDPIISEKMINEEFKMLNDLWETEILNRRIPQVQKELELVEV